MKTFVLLPLALLAISCSSQKQTVDAGKQIVAHNCPADGDCTIELLKNKALNVRKDDLGGTYYQLLDNQGTDVIRYTYTRYKDPALADNGYQEEVVLEIDSQKPQQQFATDLQATKALFGRFCFCRGATGYYPISSGNLVVEKEKGGWKISMDFEITEVPQIIKSFSMTAK